MKHQEHHFSRKYGKYMIKFRNVRSHLRRSWNKIFEASDFVLAQVVNSRSFLTWMQKNGADKTLKNKSERVKNKSR